MVLNYSIAKEGVVIDAVEFHKYLEMGDPNDPGYPDNFEGIYGIKIERQGGKEINLLYDSREDRDKEYDELLSQVRRQTISD